MGGGRLGLNGIKLKWIIGTHGNWKNQNSGGRLELQAKQLRQSSPFTSKMDQMGWIGSAV